MDRMLRPLLGVLTVIAITAATQLGVSAAELPGALAALALFAGATIAVVLGAVVYPPAYRAARGAHQPRLR